ncbi:hypothetical protein GCM10007389_33740 [Pontibacter akesuensis]|nr:hypothetical protein GCM10007389_33740 [Pontibacter akesuensis]
MDGSAIVTNQIHAVVIGKIKGYRHNWRRVRTIAGIKEAAATKQQHNGVKEELGFHNRSE